MPETNDSTVSQVMTNFLINERLAEIIIHVDLVISHLQDIRVDIDNLRIK